MSASVVESVLEKPPPSLVGLELPLRMQIHMLMPLRMRLPMRLMMLRDRQIYIRLITLTVPGG